MPKVTKAEVLFQSGAKLNRVTGRGVAIWKYANGGGLNAVTVTFSKVEGGWRGKGLSILGHPVELFFRDDGLSLTSGCLPHERVEV